MLYLVFDFAVLVSVVAVVVVCAKSFFLFHSISFVLLVGKERVFTMSTYKFESTNLMHISCSFVRFLLSYSILFFVLFRLNCLLRCVCVCFCLVCAKVYYCFNISIHQFSLLFLLIQQPLRNFLFRSLKWSLLASNSVSGFVLNADLGLSYVQHILLFLWNFLTPKWCPWKSAPCLLPDVIRNFDYYYNCVMTIMETK